MSIGLKWEKFLNVFPLESQFFVPTYNAQHSDPALSIVMQYFEQITKGDESHKMLNKQSQDINLYVQAEKNGGTIFCVSYKQPTSYGSFTEHIAVAVLNLSQATEDHLSVTPYFVLTGKKKIHCGQETLFPDAIACRIHHPQNNNAPTMTPCSIDDPDDISTGICYAEDCFKRILASLPLDITSSENWFVVDGNELNKRTSYITTRTQKQLHAEIKTLEKQTVIHNVVNFHMPAPSTWQ